MTLSDCPAWIHEAELCKILGIKSGAVYGQYNALTCVISIIKNGKGGNSKKGTAVTINPSFCCDLTITGDRNRVAFQLGGKEMFGTGSLRNIAVQQPVHWFRIGPNPALVQNSQKILVSEAVGDASARLDQKIAMCRSDPYQQYFAKDKEDGRYARAHVPVLALQCYELGGLSIIAPSVKVRGSL